MRRTASWSTSDAFTDGHMAADSEMMTPGLRTKAATSRAHGFRRFHQGSLGRSSSDTQSRSLDVRAPPLVLVLPPGPPLPPLASPPLALPLLCPASILALSCHPRQHSEPWAWVRARASLAASLHARGTQLVQ